MQESFICPPQCLPLMESLRLAVLRLVCLQLLFCHFWIQSKVMPIKSDLMLASGVQKSLIAFTFFTLSLQPSPQLTQPWVVIRVILKDFPSLGMLWKSSEGHVCSENPPVHAQHVVLFIVENKADLVHGAHTCTHTYLHTTPWECFLKKQVYYN